MAEMQPVRVTILNQTYSLRPSGQSGEIEAVAQKVDELITEMSRTQNLDSTRAAVLACCTLMGQLRALEEDFEELRSKVDSKAKQFTMLLDDAIG